MTGWRRTPDATRSRSPRVCDPPRVEPEVMDQSSDPFDQADEADLAEQRTPIVQPSREERPDVSSDRANEADILEQGAVVDDDDGEDYQRDG